MANRGAAELPEEGGTRGGEREREGELRSTDDLISAHRRGLSSGMEGGGDIPSKADGGPPRRPMGFVTTEFGPLLPPLFLIERILACPIIAGRAGPQKIQG